MNCRMGKFIKLKRPISILVFILNENKINKMKFSKRFDQKTEKMFSKNFSILRLVSRKFKFSNENFLKVKDFEKSRKNWSQTSKSIHLGYKWLQSYVLFGAFMPFFVRPALHNYLLLLLNAYSILKLYMDLLAAVCCVFIAFMYTHFKPLLLLSVYFVCLHLSRIQCFYIAFYDAKCASCWRHTNKLNIIHIFRNSFIFSSFNVAFSTH